MLIKSGSNLNDSVIGKSLEPIRLFAEDLMEEAQQVNMIPKLFYVDSIDQFAGSYTGNTSARDFSPVGEGGIGPQATQQETFRKVIEPYTFKLNEAITKEHVDDNQIGNATERIMRALVTSYMRTRQKVAAQMFINGHNTSFTFDGVNFSSTSADGRAYFATNHQSRTGLYQDQSNLFDLEFSYDNLLRVEELMQDFRNDNGEIIDVAPTTILVPNTGRAFARVVEVLGAELIPGSGNNDASAIAGRFEIVKWTRLNDFTGQTAGTFPWWVIDSKFNQQYGGMIWQDREEINTTIDYEPATQNTNFHSRSRFNTSGNNWRAMAACIPGMGTSF